MRYAMLMRGVNVGGIRVPMAELRELLTALGLGGVRTVLQTGNVAFDSEDDAATLAAAIERAAGERFGYDAHVQIYSRDRLAEVIAAYPFAAKPDAHRYVVFCADEATVDELLAADGAPGEGELLSRGRGVVYWRVARGRTLATPFASHLARERFRARATNRNLNTLEKLVAA